MIILILGLTVASLALAGTGDRAQGATSVVLHFDGARWEVAAQLPDVELNAVWGASHQEVFAVAGLGRIFYYDGRTWEKVYESRDHRASLYGVSGTSRGNVFAVGSRGTVLHFNGHRWTEKSTGGHATLNGVFVLSRTDAFAAGGFVSPDGGGVVRFDGESWEVVTTVRGESLYDVWASSVGNVFAVGFHKAAIARFDGGSWEIVWDSENLDYFQGVWGRSADDVFVVGSSIKGPEPVGRVLHYDGQEWQVVLTTTEALFRDVWGDARGHVFAVGRLGAIFEYDGSRWEQMQSKTTAHLTGVWASADGQAFAVGFNDIRADAEVGD